MFRVLLLSALLFVNAPDAIAQPATWPVKPIHMIIPVAPGSSTDVIPRMVAEQLAVQLGQPIIIENRAGAGGTIGSAEVAKARPDGYTLLALGSALTIAPSLYPDLPFDPLRDLVPVAALGSSPSVLVVSPASGFHSAADLIAAAKSKPGRLTYSSVGVGSATHLSAERFLAAAGIEALHVPFKGGAEAMTEVMAGRCDFFFAPVAIALPQIRGGKLVALGVNGSRRSAALPDVPTLGEIGLRNAEYPIWFAIFAPARTPPGIVDRLNEQTREVLESRELHDQLAAMGVDPMPMTPEELQRFVQAEVTMNATLVKSVGVTEK